MTPIPPTHTSARLRALLLKLPRGASRRPRLCPWRSSSSRPLSSRFRRPHTLAAATLLLTMLQPHPPNVLAKPRALLPIMLLPREHIPLAYLDLSAPHGDLPACRYFESRIRIMELEGRLGSNILVARSDSGENVYIIEREESGLYVLCKLGAWVDLDKLSHLATVLCHQRVHPSTSQAKHIGLPEPPLVTPKMYKENKRRRLAIEEIQSKVRRQSKPQRAAAAVATPDQQPRPIQLPTPESAESQPRPVEKPCIEQVRSLQPVAPSKPISPHIPAADDALADQPAAEDIFQNIRTQYFEALYHSMVWYPGLSVGKSLELTELGVSRIFCQRAAFPSSSGFSSRL